jgi:hypothetical protein
MNTSRYYLLFIGRHVNVSTNCLLLKVSSSYLVPSTSYLALSEMIFQENQNIFEHYSI